MARFTKGGASPRLGYWRLNITRIENDGTKKRLTKQTHIRCGEKRSNEQRAKSELGRWRDSLIREDEIAIAKESVVDSGTRFQDYIGHYLERHRCSDSTRHHYEVYLRKLMGTPLGVKPLCELEPRDFADYEKTLYDAGLSANTVAHYHAFFAQVIKYALANADLARSPIAAVRAPRKGRKPVNALSAADAAVVMSSLGSMQPSPLSEAGQIALYTGMRRGEICALRWLDVDLPASTIHVAHALTLNADGGWKLSSPKDTRGYGSLRDVPVPSPLADLLIAIRDRQRTACDLLGMAWDRRLFVIGDQFGKFKNPDALTNEWRALAKVSGWRGQQGRYVTFHDLRHTFATITIAQGADVMSVASILGHRNPSMTLDVYAMALAEPKRKTMARLANLFEKSSPSDDQGEAGQPSACQRAVPHGTYVAPPDVG